MDLFVKHSKVLALHSNSTNTLLMPSQDSWFTAYSGGNYYKIKMSVFVAGDNIPTVQQHCVVGV